MMSLVSHWLNNQGKTNFCSYIVHKSKYITLNHKAMIYELVYRKLSRRQQVTLSQLEEYHAPTRTAHITKEKRLKN